MRKSLLIIFGTATVALFSWRSSLAQTADPLQELVKPNAVKPRTWWHWVGGNIAKRGITKDLEWMKRVGLGGFQVSDVGGVIGLSELS